MGIGEAVLLDFGHWKIALLEPVVCTSTMGIGVLPQWLLGRWFFPISDTGESLLLEPAR